MYRQGDLLIVPVTKPDYNLSRVENGIVEYGEAMGHAHRLVDGTVYNGGAILHSPGALVSPTMSTTRSRYPKVGIR